MASWPAYRFLKRQVRWSGILISQNFPQLIVIHTVKRFGCVQTADRFLVVLYKKGIYSGTKTKLGVDIGEKFHFLPNTVFLIGEFGNVGYVQAWHILAVAQWKVISMTRPAFSWSPDILGFVKMCLEVYWVGQ